MVPIFCLFQKRDPNSFGHVLFHGYHEFFCRCSKTSVIVQRKLPLLLKYACLGSSAEGFFLQFSARYVVKRLFKKKVSLESYLPPGLGDLLLGVLIVSVGLQSADFYPLFYILFPPNNRILACISLRHMIVVFCVP